MIINGESLTAAAPIADMLTDKHQAHGVSYGLSEAGYDIRIKQRVQFVPPDPVAFICVAPHLDDSFAEETERLFFGYTIVGEGDAAVIKLGRCALASSVELFDVPKTMWGELRNKSTHARAFVDGSNGTDVDPGFRGHLTIELTFNDVLPVTIPAGSGIAKFVFHELSNPAEYSGKYQDQPDRPVEAKHE